LTTGKLMPWLLAALIFAGACKVSAQETKPTTTPAEKQQVIKEMLLASRACRNAELGYNMVIDQEIKGMDMAIASRIDQDASLSPKQRAQAKQAALARADKRMQRFKELTARQINMPELVNDVYMKLYNKYFTQDELKAMLAFYQSPAGQKSLDVLPQLSNEAVSMINGMILPRLKKVSEQMDDELRSGKLE
jgi:uncharacterized protein